MLVRKVVAAQMWLRIERGCIILTVGLQGPDSECVLLGNGASRVAAGPNQRKAVTTRRTGDQIRLTSGVSKARIQTAGQGFLLSPKH